MATGKKEAKEPTSKPDFQKGDRVSGVVSYIVERQRKNRIVSVPTHLDARMTDYFHDRAMRELQEPRGTYDNAYQAEEVYERTGNKDFFIVMTPPYKASGKWHMTVRPESSAVEQEVFCKDFHLVGERKAYEPLIDKKTKEKIVKLSKPAIVTAIVLAFIAITGMWLAANYNDLVHARNDVRNSRSKIDTELTRRYDLIDNIVASVQGSQAQESDVFGKIAEARKVGGNSSDPAQQAAANETISTQIALLPKLQEAYPELRSNDQVTRLIGELQGTNNTIRDVRNGYNDTVTNYNNNVTSFPKSIFAAVFNFDQEKLFEATAQERVNPKVDLNREK